MQIPQIFEKQIARGCGYLFGILLAAPPLFVHHPFPLCCCCCCCCCWDSRCLIMASYLPLGSLLLLLLLLRVCIQAYSTSSARASSVSSFRVWRQVSFSRNSLSGSLSNEKKESLSPCSFCLLLLSDCQHIPPFESVCSRD
jgi:hypothetical protein